GSLALLLLLKRLAPHWPAALLVVVLAILIVTFAGLEQAGVKLVGGVSTSLPTLHWPQVSIKQYLNLIPGALAILLLGYIETLGADEGAALKDGGDADPDQELIALGASNLGAGMSGGFVAVGSLSKTSVAMDAGGKTQIAYVFTGLLVLLTLRFLMPLLANLPHATLAAIVVAAMIDLDQTAKLVRFWRYNPIELGLGLVALFGVLILGILPGVGLGVGMSLLVLIWRSAHPGVAVLGQMHDDCTFRDIARHPEAKTYPGLLIFRIDAQLTFPDSRYFVAMAKREVARAKEPVQVVLIDAETINDVDITGADALKKLHISLAKQGINLWLAQVKDPVFDKLLRMEVIAIIGPHHCFKSVKAAVQAFEKQ
ncbi:MAG: STAS domain-containing protein, partial [Chloroflexi bacterium]|nr:STAS domain-containing protein [Chloroflexota bacterium]